LCREIAPFDGVYVTHMRGYAPHTIEASMDEVRRIGSGAGCRVHVSHFNSLAELAIPQMDRLERSGGAVSFDLYCYLFGSTILGMIALPPAAMAGGVDATLARLRDPAFRSQVREWVAKPRFDLDRVRLGSVPADEYRHLEGRTLAEAVEWTGRPLADLIVDLLLATETATNAVVPHLAGRADSDIAALMRDRRMAAGRTRGGRAASPATWATMSAPASGRSKRRSPSARGGRPRSTASRTAAALLRGWRPMSSCSTRRRSATARRSPTASCWPRGCGTYS
jgi:N-acyl-D-amino-acid deacylase